MLKKWKLGAVSDEENKTEVTPPNTSNLTVWEGFYIDFTVYSVYKNSS